MSNSNIPASELLTEPEAAVYLRCSLSKLQRLRKRKCGPVPTRIGRNIRYRKSALDAFLDKHSSEAA